MTLLRADIRKAMQHRRLTKDMLLAVECGISPQYISDLMRGRRNLSPKILSKLAGALRVSPMRYRKWQRLGAREAGWDI